MKIYKKYIVFIVLIFMTNLSFGVILPSTIKEDIEINKLEEQIKIMQNKINELNEIKKRKINNPSKNIKIGLALSGGGAKGMAHIGVLKVLESLNIRPDYITGTSMGAIIGALYSVGYSPDEIEKILLDKKWKAFIDSGFVSPEIPLEKQIISKKYMMTVRFDNKFNFSFPKGISTTQGIYFELKKLLSRASGITDFDKLPIPLRIIATDLNTGKAKAFSNGDLAKAITASIAIPTIFEPVEIDKRLYVDGLVSRNLPVIDAYDMGANLVIASDVGNELKDKNDYNIISVLNQLIAIQSAKSTKEQQSLATILITPNVTNDSAINFEDSEKFIYLGEEATLDKINLLEKISTDYSKKNLVPFYLKDKKIMIENIIYSKNLNDEQKKILNSLLSQVYKKELTYNEIEKHMARLSGTDFVKSVYYEIKDNDLILDITTNPTNTIGIGVNYLTGYGTTFNMGTSISNFGTIGNNSLINIKLGDYNGISLDNFIYYGQTNKIGIFANISYEENPLIIYDDNRKISDSLVKTFLFETGILTQYNNNVILSYGIDTRYNRVRQRTGSFKQKDINSDRNYSGAFIRASYDDIQEVNNHKNNGIKSIFEYSLENSFTKSNSNLYGPTYLFDGYYKFLDKFTLNYGFSGGFMNNNKIKTRERSFKIGGIKDDFANKTFSFYGMEFGEKLVDKFFLTKIGLDYEVFPNAYIGGRYNFGTFHELRDKKNIFEEYRQGCGVSFVYDSIAGPFEFTLTRDQRGRYISQIAIGYLFE